MNKFTCRWIHWIKAIGRCSPAGPGCLTVTSPLLAVIYICIYTVCINEFVFSLFEIYICILSAERGKCHHDVAGFADQNPAIRAFCLLVIVFLCLQLINFKLVIICWLKCPNWLFSTKLNIFSTWRRWSSPTSPKKHVCFSEVAILIGNYIVNLVQLHTFTKQVHSHQLYSV